MGIMDWFRRRSSAAPAAAESDLLARITAAIEATRTPFIRIAVAERDEALAPTASKLGGVPYVPEDAALPDGEPLAFIAQINFADFVLEPFPRAGLVQFWVAADDTYGLFRDDPKTGFRCCYYPDLDRPQRAALPASPPEGSPLDAARVAVGRGLTFHRDDGVVPPDDYQWPTFLARHQIPASRVLPAEIYTRFAATGHRIGGYCAFTQDDPRTAEDPKLSLLQLDSDEHVFWGDTGIAHWFIREADLRARDFSRVEYYWDCC